MGAPLHIVLRLLLSWPIGSKVSPGVQDLLQT